MTFTYDIGTASDDIAYIRLRIQDTEEEEALFSDEEIERVLDDEENDKNRAVDTLLTIRKVMLSTQPSVMQKGASAIRTDITGQLKALDSGQRRNAALKDTVQNFVGDSSFLERDDV